MKAIINAELVMKDHLIPEAVLFIKDGKIAGYGEMRTTEIPEGCEIIDAKGAYVGPGLVDIHSHAGNAVRFQNDPYIAAEGHLDMGTTSVLATLALFYAVGRWNGFSDALMYVKDETLFPIQLLLYNILQNTTAIEIGTQEGFFDPGVGETMKMATVMFATVPILVVYPWLQRYFVTGVTIGAVKG